MVLLVLFSLFGCDVSSCSCEPGWRRGRKGGAGGGEGGGGGWGGGRRGGGVCYRRYERLARTRTHKVHTG